MKKAFLLFLVILMTLAMTACDIVLGGGDGQTTTNDTAFDTGKVTFQTAYVKAQSLGFEGTLDEFIEMISGKDGVDGKDGKDGVGIASVIVDENGDLLVILSDGRMVNCGNVRGKDGADGKTPYIQNGYWYIDGVNTGVKAEGTDGADGKDGTPGRPGATGAPGADGKDGEDGAPGKDGVDGAPGKDGADGITPTFKIENGELFVSYDSGATWLLLGTVQGADGEDGAPGKDGADGTPGKDGVDGAPGKDGADGKDGATGATGVGIEKVEFDENGDLLITFTDGSTQTVAMPEKQEHVHSFGEYINYAGNATVSCENRLFYRICNECKVIEWKNGSYENHEFVTKTIAPTCTADGYDEKTCTICGAVETLNETPEIGHEYSERYASDSTYHWKECVSCGAETAKSAHVIDGEICIVCDPSVQPTEGLMYELSADGTYAELIAYSGTATHIVIADTYKGVPVTNIYEKVFKNNKTITAVVIPDSVTTIGDAAFYNCSNLTNVTIGDSVTTISGGAFSSCSKLTSITIGDSVTTIGRCAFWDCDGLTSIIIPDSVATIGEEAFYNCSNLTNVTIGDSVTTIGVKAFSSCSKLTSITIGDSVTTIGESAFFGCHSSLYTEYEYGTYIGDAENPYAILYALTNKNFSSYTLHADTKIIAYGVFSRCGRLTSITAPDGVTAIGDYAFNDCSNLTSVTIPDGVTTIGESAFNDCSNLTSITFEGTVEQWNAIGKDSFWNSNVPATEVICSDGIVSLK